MEKEEKGEQADFGMGGGGREEKSPLPGQTLLALLQSLARPEPGGALCGFRGGGSPRPLEGLECKGPTEGEGEGTLSDFAYPDCSSVENGAN